MPLVALHALSAKAAGPRLIVGIGWVWAPFLIAFVFPAEFGVFRCTVGEGGTIEMVSRADAERSRQIYWRRALIVIVVQLKFGDGRVGGA